MAANCELTPREARFLDEYGADANATQAAIRAGAAPAGAHVWACRALRKTKVAAALKARQEADSERLQITRDRVVAGLLEAVALARDRREPAAMISAWSAIAKMLGLYAPERRLVEVTSVSAQGEMARLERMSDAELAALIAGPSSGLGR